MTCMISHPTFLGSLLSGALMLPLAARGGAAAPSPTAVEANHVAEVSLVSAKTYPNPFMDVELNALVTPPAGAPMRVPAFWAGGNRWCFRYASPLPGRHIWRTECSDGGNRELHAVEGQLDVTPNRDANPLYRHGPIHVAEDHRHFVHVDGRPFFWLGDTWWKNLCKRMTWESFQELTADRKAKGFSVVQIVCGPYPDEALFEPSWENEGGKPYETRDFSVVNPRYFEYADRRIKRLVEAGIVPAIVGGWGRGDCDGMQVGVAGLKRHWRNLLARYGAYPTTWIIGGESGGPQWTEVARYVQATDPYHHPATMHPADSGRKAVTDETVIAFDMLQTGHGDWSAALGAIPKLRAAYGRTPPMPAMIGEYCYEGHMQTGFQDQQRYVFWGSMLSGAAGLTYGAAGVWSASVEGDPGSANVYDLTTWKEGMAYPGSTQLGLGKKLLEQYPWARFEPHPEWCEESAFAAGIPGEVRFIYQKRGIYNWSGPLVKNLERDVPYHAFYFNPTNGKRYDQGTLMCAGPPPDLSAGHRAPVRFADRFEGADASAWQDYGTATQRQDGRLVGGKGMLTVLEKVNDTDLMASVEANSNAEAGLILRFHDPDNYLVALYSPLFKTIFIHDRRNGQWGANLGEVAVPEIGLKIELTAAVCGKYATLLLTDGKRKYQTPLVAVTNLAAGKAGLWLHHIGDRQEFAYFRLSGARFGPPQRDINGRAPFLVWSGQDKMPPMPSPQDWVLVLERVKQ